MIWNEKSALKWKSMIRIRFMINSLNPEAFDESKLNSSSWILNRSCTLKRVNFLPKKLVQTHLIFMLGFSPSIAYIGCRKRKSIITQKSNKKILWSWKSHIIFHNVRNNFNIDDNFLLCIWENFEHQFFYVLLLLIDINKLEFLSNNKKYFDNIHIAIFIFC